MPAPLSRRAVLAAGASLLAAGFAEARTVRGAMPWAPSAGEPPVPAQPGPWEFFSPEEGAAMEAIVDRLIPPDPETPGGKDTGCAVFIDRQLAGPYGRSAGLYMSPPFQDGDPNQGLQSPLTPALRYRQSLAALDKHCRAAFAGKGFAELPDEQKDKLLQGLEKGEVTLHGASGKAFFQQALANTQEGFFADPIYGGNRDMAAWKMIGFPGARYDYRDWVTRYNERYPLPPVSIGGRPEWARRKA